LRKRIEERFCELGRGTTWKEISELVKVRTPPNLPPFWFLAVVGPWRVRVRSAWKIE